ncbi:MAG: hypothetical protein JST16_14890 [Bdellovibrionales bacterium]|nr:hypothetical protein [Bdellovibrionales bacterium]
MKRTTSIQRSGLTALLFVLALSGCTGVLNDNSTKAGATAISLLDDESNKLLWKKLNDLKGNKKELSISGECGSEIPKVTVEVIPADKSVSKWTFDATCNNGTLNANFKSANKFPSNGRYRVLFSGEASDGTVVVIERYYDLYYVENPSSMVALKCVDSLTETNIPIVSDECTVTKTQNLRIDGTCTTDATSHSTTATLQTTISKSCPSFSQDYASLTTGPHLIPITWTDPWNNTYTVTLLVKKLDTLDWQGGGVSFVSAVNFAPTNSNIPVQIAMATGSPWAPVSSDINNTVPFARAPASTSGGGESRTLAPGYLSLVYGLSDSD